MAHRSWTLVVIILLLVTHPILGQFNQSGDFRAGDGVRIIVWQEPGFDRAKINDLGISDDYIIENDGEIFLPIIGEVMVVGKSQAEFARFLEEKYKKFASGLHFMCKPLIRVAMLGAVQHPGLYLIENTGSLWELIDLAGGPLANVDMKKTYIKRSDQIVAENLLNQTENAYTLIEIGVRSGDQITLFEQRSFSWRTLLDVSSFVISLVVLGLQINRETNR